MTNRIRYLKPDFFLDEDISKLPPLIRLFYQGLWTHADREGRLEDRPQRLKVEIMPYEDNFDAEDALAILARPKRPGGPPYINRYETDGERYIQILTWKRHQKPHHTERPSEIPPPLSHHGSLTVKEPLDNGSLTGRNGDGDGDGDEKGKEEGVWGRGKPRRDMSGQSSAEENAPPAPSRGSGSDETSEPSCPQRLKPEISETTIRGLMKSKGREWVIDYLKQHDYPIPEFLTKIGGKT